MSKLLCLSFVLATILATISGNSAEEIKKNNDRLTRDCVNSYSLTCLKLDVVSFVEKLSDEESFTIFPGVSLVRENASSTPNTADMVSELAREFPNDAEARLDAFLSKKIGGYLKSHSIRLNFWNTESNANNDSSARGGKDKKNGGMMYLMAAGAMMKGMMMAMGMAGLAAMAGKALMTGMISLLLSAIIGVKSLTHSGGKSTTYEIVSKPVYSHTNSHSTEVDHAGHYSAYGRSLVDVPLPLQKNFAQSS